MSECMNVLEGDRSKARAAIETIAPLLARATSLSRGEAETLEAAWAGLVALLALGPQPEWRACPSCGSAGMRAATRCGKCWMKLTPIV